MITDPTFLFCTLFPSDRSSFDEHMAPLLERLPKGSRDILSELSGRQLDDQPLDIICTGLGTYGCKTRHSFWCFGGKCKCICKCRLTPTRMFKCFALCNKQEGRDAGVVIESGRCDKMTWGDVSMLFPRERPQGITLWVPLENGMYEWTTALCNSYVFGSTKEVFVQRGLGRIEWNSDRTNARLLKVGSLFVA